MVYACQERQGWYREFSLITRQPEAEFVGSARLQDHAVAVAASMAEALGFDLEARATCRTEEALRLFIMFNYFKIRIRKLSVKCFPFVL